MINQYILKIGFARCGMIAVSGYYSNIGTINIGVSSQQEGKYYEIS
jgi:hypothetical protein